MDSLRRRDGYLQRVFRTSSPDHGQPLKNNLKQEKQYKRASSHEYGSLIRDQHPDQYEGSELNGTTRRNKELRQEIWWIPSLAGRDLTS